MSLFCTGQLCTNKHFIYICGLFNEVNRRSGYIGQKGKIVREYWMGINVVGSDHGIFKCTKLGNCIRILIKIAETHRDNWLRGRERKILTLQLYL
jgi:hypothetical protein